MNVRQSSFKEYYEQLVPLVEAHGAEILTSPLDKSLKFEPNYDLYGLLEDMKTLVATGLFTDDDELVGYICIFVYQHPHHKGIRFASGDSFYIKPEYRGMGTFALLMKETEVILRDKYGVSYLQLSSHDTHDISGPLSRIGYVLTEKVFVKKL